MENKNIKQELVYIRGVKGRGKEVMQMLEDLGGKNLYGFTSTNSSEIYTLNEGVINVFTESEDAYKIITQYGRELHLPEKSQVLKWEDLKAMSGFRVMGNTIESVMTSSQCFGSNYFVYGAKGVFAAEQQAKSAQAAAMISQIREQGKETYGEIVELNEDAWTLTYFNGGISTDALGIIDNYGGLLRFETKEQAELFLENNRELVEEYLKTF